MRVNARKKEVKNQKMDSCEGNVSREVCTPCIHILKYMFVCTHMYIWMVIHTKRIWNWNKERKRL